MTLRVLSWNVRSLRDDVGQLTARLRALAPDVVCVQEAPRLWRWRSRCAALARRSGLLVATGGRDAGDCLLLVSQRVRVVSAESQLLPRTPGLHRRGLALAELELAGHRLVAGSAHLGLRADERLAHAALVAERLTGIGLPVVLGADVNESPGEPAWEALAARWPAAPARTPTFPARAPSRRIDAVFTGLPVLDAAVEVGTQAATDHLAVRADLDLATQPLPEQSTPAQPALR